MNFENANNDSPVTLPDDPASAMDESGPEFRICDEHSANWVVRKITELRSYQEKVKRWAEREVHRAATDEKRLLFLYEAQLQVWTLAEIKKARDGRRSVRLPAGRIGYRKLRTKLVIDDVDAVLHWARSECPQAVVLKEKLDRTTLNAHLQNTGEMPDQGAHVEPEHDAFFIE